MKIIFLIDTKNFSTKFWVVLKILQVKNSPKYVGITENYLCFHRVRKAPRWSIAGYDVSLFKRMLLRMLVKLKILIWHSTCDKTKRIKQKFLPLWQFLHVFGPVFRSSEFYCLVIRAFYSSGYLRYFFSEYLAHSNNQPGDHKERLTYFHKVCVNTSTAANFGLFLKQFATNNA